MLYGPEISQYVPCMLQFSDNLWRFFIYYNYIAEIANFTLDLLKNFDYSRNPGPTKKFSKTREASIISGPQLNISINTRTSENIIWSNISIQMWSTNKDWKTG